MPFRNQVVGDPSQILFEIGTLLLADGAVTEPKLADLAVATAKLQNLAVTTAKLGPDAVTGGKVADDAIGREHLSPTVDTSDPTLRSTGTNPTGFAAARGRWYTLGELVVWQFYFQFSGAASEGTGHYLIAPETEGLPTPHADYANGDIIGNCRVYGDATNEDTTGVVVYVGDDEFRFRVDQHDGWVGVADNIPFTPFDVNDVVAGTINYLRAV